MNDRNKILCVLGTIKMFKAMYQKAIDDIKRDKDMSAQTTQIVLKDYNAFIGHLNVILAFIESGEK